jgi:hypothetical protein
MGALRVILPAINHKLINIKHHVLSSPRDERHINQMIYNYLILGSAFMMIISVDEY